MGQIISCVVPATVNQNVATNPMATIPSVATATFMPPNWILVDGVGNNDITDRDGSLNTGFRIDGNENGSLAFIVFSLPPVLGVLAVPAH